MATLGLIVLVPLLERGTFGLLQRHFLTNQIGLPMALLNELVIITLAAQIATGPLIMYHFGRFSLVSLLSNLLILPVQLPHLGQSPFWLLALIYALLAATIWWGNQPEDNQEPTPRFRLPAVTSVGTRLWVGSMGVVALCSSGWPWVRCRMASYM